MSGRVSLRYSVDLTESGTFFLLADGYSIRANLGEAESKRHVVELAVRFRKARPGALHIRPLDGDLLTWLVESAVLHKDLARMELLLTQVPANVSWAFLEI